jgi:hypothetical protein
VANATDIVKKGVVRRTDEFIELPVETLSAETRFWPNALIGLDATGYACKGDDTQSWLMAGVVTQDQGAPLLPASTAGDGTAILRVQQPQRLEIAIASIAVTDRFKPVYALFDQTGTLDPSATTYANLIGHVVAVVASGIALVEPAYDGIGGNVRLSAAKVLAATGAQTLSKTDLGKRIIIPNTAAIAVTLPAVASCPAGSWFWFTKTTAAGGGTAVTLTGNGAENINGSNTNNTIDAQYDTMTIVSTGTEWIIDDDVA